MRRDKKKQEEKKKDTLTNLYLPWFLRRHHDTMVHRHILPPRPRSRPSQILLLSSQIHFSRSTTNQQLGRTKHQMEKRPSHGVINRSEILASFLDGMSCNGNVLPLEIPPFPLPPFPPFYIFSSDDLFLTPLLLLLQQKRSATAPSPPSCPSSSPDSASVPSTRSSSRCPQEPTAAPSCS